MPSGQTDASDIRIVHNHYISAIAYEPRRKDVPNTNAYRLPADGARAVPVCSGLLMGAELDAQRVD